MAKQRRRSTRSNRPSSNDPELALKTRHLHPGDCISVDHYVSPVPARRRSGYGKSTSFVGGALYVDHASGHIFHYPQSDLTADSTILGKQLLEDEAKSVSVSIKHYHSDNGIFSTKAFKDHCRSLNQSFSFCGVGAHHQNAVAERCIGTIWPERCNLNLWALAMDYAVWIYNRTPKESLSGLSPKEFWSSARSDHNDLRRAHPFGCPVYVLDPHLQDGKSIPKWSSRSRQGMFVGFSSEHSSLVPLVLNLDTGYISPQYHVIFDDSFHTVPSAHSSVDKIDDAFASLFDTGARERFIDDPSEVSEGARSDALPSEEDEPTVSPIGLPSTAPEGAVPMVPIIESDSDQLDEDKITPAIDIHNFDPPPEAPQPSLRRSSRVKRSTPRLIMACAMLLPLGEDNYATWGQPALDSVNFGHQRCYHVQSKISRAYPLIPSHISVLLSPQCILPLSPASPILPFICLGMVTTTPTILHSSCSTPRSRAPTP